MAMVEILDVLPEDYERRIEVKDLFRKAMASVVEYQQLSSSVWYDVLDVDDERNYLEATASSMFTYCLLKGHRLGYLDDTYLEAGIKAYKGLVKEFIKEENDGTILLTRCCKVSGLGPESNPKRDGSFDYYMSEPIRSNDAKGVGPFIWASLEMERMGYTVQNLYTYSVGIDDVQTSSNAPSQRNYSLDGRMQPVTAQPALRLHHDGKKWVKIIK